MELWIRSQDRLNLTKVNSVTIDYNYQKKIVANYMEFNGDEDYVPLGEYDTEERALEVLDDIENKLINCTFAEKQNGLGEVLDFMPNSIYVYTMPKE